MLLKYNLCFVNTVSLSLILLLLINGIECKASVTVKAKQFNGFSKTVDGKRVDIFLGIPYAKPPIGDLRFRKPVPLNSFDKPIDATQWPNPCVQRIMPEQLFLYHNKNFSEDCLYLNIWTPINATDQALKPVLFWIHGGALITGSSNVFFTTGETLAIKGDIVVVSINYRLDHFGFLYSGTDDAPGNVGLWDQALALKWVNDNVEHFGGDREKITLFGASAGGWSVSLHLISPITRHLFKNAVVMSGSAHSVFTKDKRDALNLTRNIASKHNCNVGVSADKAVECLRRVSANDLVADTSFTVENVIDYRLLYGDEFMPENPLAMLRKGDFKRNANVLLGTTDDEGSLLMAWLYNYTAYEESTEIIQRKSEAINELTNVLKKFDENLEIAAKRANKLYISQLPESNYDLIRRSIATAIGDYVITCPVTHLAATLFNYNQFANNSNASNNGKIYEYVFGASTKENSWRGSDHYSDVAYWFGNVPQTASNKMIDILSSFAYNGKPSPQEGIEWPNYYTIGNKLVTPYYRITAKPSLNQTNYGYGYKPQCDYLWNKYLEE